MSIYGRGDVKAARCIWDLGHPVRQFSARVSCDFINRTEVEVVHVIQRLSRFVTSLRVRTVRTSSETITKLCKSRVLKIERVKRR